jgi:hypothetical protein
MFSFQPRMIFNLIFNLNFNDWTIKRETSKSDLKYNDYLKSDSL